jgi:peptidoglycan/LPS O-acetylase OafA/YrhL
VEEDVQEEKMNGATAGSAVRRLPRVPALDGLRTIAVVLTSLVHLVPQAVPGGIFGVDLFFVLSGFLITSILLDHHSLFGRIDLKSFYLRRARRLLPAVVLVLAVFTVVVLLSGPSRRELEVAAVVDTAVITYTFNWADIFGHSPPWQTDHLWSLSVEEQFYIVWPIVLVVLLRIVSRRSLMTLTLAAAVVSSLVQAAVFAATHSTSWAYESSPLHAQGILFGCFLAQVFVWRKAERSLHWLAAHWWPAATGLAVLIVLALSTGVDDPATYEGGMALVVVAAGVAIATMVADVEFGTNGNWLSRALSSRPMVLIGQRSYSIYLWQNYLAWALTASLRHTIWWIPANVVATLLVAEISFRFVERRFLRPSQPALPRTTKVL